MSEFTARKFERAHLDIISNRLAQLKSKFPEILRDIDLFIKYRQKAPEVEATMDAIKGTHDYLQTINELEIIADSYLTWLEKLTTVIIFII